MADAQRLISLGMAPELAKEVAEQVATGGLQIGTTSTTAMAGNRVPTTTIRGGVVSSAAIANITPATDGTTAGTAVNAILAALRTAGIIAT